MDKTFAATKVKGRFSNEQSNTNPTKNIKIFLKQNIDNYVRCVRRDKLLYQCSFNYLTNIKMRVNVSTFLHCTLHQQLIPVLPADENLRSGNSVNTDNDNEINVKES